MSNNKQITIVMNGKGGVGKDTLCLSLSSRRVRNISSITPIKEIAANYGWN
jgi:guanylate kinase